MRYLDAHDVARALPWSALIGAIEETIAAPGAHAPERTVYTVGHPSGPDLSLLVKPGWVVGDVIVVKAVTFVPDNGTRGLPTVNAGVLLFDGVDGTLRGTCDGNELTTRRTAAASALAAARLARSDASRLLVVGTGALSPMVAQAHAAVRDYDEIAIWGRRDEAADAVVETLIAAGLPAVRCADLDHGIAGADVISCVTGSSTPLVRGALLRPGAHVDLIGAFTAEMRESDDDVIRRGSVWVDSFADGVLAGDLAQPLAAGIITTDDLRGDLRGLVTGEADGRSSADEITVFKSAGIALEDVAAARLVFATPADGRG